MIEKIIPKFKRGFVVYDREMHKEYTILSFNYQQLNTDLWYEARDNDTQDITVICESWLTFVSKPRFEDSR